MMKIAQFSSFGRPEAVIECIEVTDVPRPKANEIGIASARGVDTILDIAEAPINGGFL